RVVGGASADDDVRVEVVAERLPAGAGARRSATLAFPIAEQDRPSGTQGGSRPLAVGTRDVFPHHRRDGDAENPRSWLEVLRPPCRRREAPGVVQPESDTRRL